MMMEMNEAYGEQQTNSSQNGVNQNGGSNCHQYCLKWNNHKLNISGVFDRLRASQQFCDLTLSSADKRTVKCHKILLCAGSGYLEEILTENPSEHPTIVLSQINYEELKHLVDFMYSGEVAVETDKLGKLLEAARILKIKGLWESGLDETDDDTGLEDDISSNTTEQLAAVNEVLSQRQQAANLQALKATNDTALDVLNYNKLNASLNSVSKPSFVSGSQKRKRKSNQQPKINSDINKNSAVLDQLNQGHIELTTSNNKIPRFPSPSPSTSSTHSSASSPVSSILSPNSLSGKSPPSLVLPNTPISLSSSNVVDIAKSLQQYGPMFGVSNAYFLTQPPPLNMILDSNSTGGSLRSSKSSDSSTSAEDISSKLAGLTTPLPPKTIDKLLKDIPKLLAQTPLTSSSPTLVPSSIASSITSNAISPLLSGMMIPSNANGVASLNISVDKPSQLGTRTPNPKHKKDNDTSSIRLVKHKSSEDSPSSLPGLISKNTYQQPPTTGEILANGLQLSVAPVRRYKQYTEETLQQALREIMEGQSINRSSMKYNIPARTLRDWMKRLNIKSVFTHNHSTSSSSTSSSNQNQSKTSENLSPTDSTKHLTKANISVTSVELPESTIAIKDIIKLQTTSSNASTGGGANAAKINAVDGQETERTAIKIENDADSIKNEIISNILKKVSLSHTLTSSSAAVLGNSATTLATTSTQEQHGNISSTDLSILKANMNPSKRLEIVEDNDEDDEEEEEEIDDDEEAL